MGTTLPEARREPVWLGFVTIVSSPIAIETVLNHDDAPTKRGDAELAPARKINYADEECFHDEWGKAIDPAVVPVVESFEACTAPENRFVMDWLGDVRGLRVLDIGCGAGEGAVYFALRGAKVTAIDLSTGMLTVTGKVAARYGVSVKCVQAKAEDLGLPDSTFDIVYASNMLHHVDMTACLGEVCRVLKPGGRFVSWDPLRHNPIINAYRKLAAGLRTEDEQPLSIGDLSTFRNSFQTVEHRCFWLASLWIFMRFFLIERVHPSKQRYWKKIITSATRLSRTYHRLARIDDLLLRAFPWLECMCWNLVVCCQHPIKKPMTLPARHVLPPVDVIRDARFVPPVA